MSDNKLIYFSIVSGQIYEIPEDMKDILDVYQLQLSNFPNSSCKKCHGRFYTGFDVKLRCYIICKQCAKKILIIPQDEITMETPVVKDSIVFND